MQKLDPQAVWLFFFTFFLRGFIFIFIFITWGAFYLFMLEVSLFKILIWLLGVVIPLLLIFCWIWAKLTYRFYRYELREDGFRKESGVIWKKYVTIPYGRIQNVDIYRGVIARLLGLSDLHIQTAGASVQVSRYRFSGGAEGRLPGVSREIAEQLRDELIRRAHQSQTSNQGL